MQVRHTPDEEDREEEPDEENNTPVTDAEFEQYCDVINQHEQPVRKYGIIGYQTEFRIKDIEDEEMDVDQLCRLLKRIIQRLINEAVHNAEQAGIAPEWMGFVFKGEGMKKNEYLIPFRRVEHNTAEKLLQEIKNCARSSSVADLVGKELSLKVTLHRTPDEYQELEGAGMKETLKKRGSNVNRHALLMDPMADDSDFLCFFKAIVLTKLYHDTVKDYHKTGALQANKKRLLGEARHLAAASGIKVRPQVRYGEKHAQAVQDYFELVNPGKLACKICKQCPKCGYFWKPRDVDDVEHDCSAKKCGKCLAKHSGECFIVKPKLNKDHVNRIVAFDFECKVNKKGQDGKTLHEPNYLTAHITCTKCIDAGCWKDVSKKDCRVCGPEKLKAWPERAHTERITMEFLEWLLRDLPKKYETLACAHNGARYDNHFVLQELYNRGPAFLKFTTTGNKVCEVRQQKTKNTNTLILRDSLLLFGPGSKLATLPKTFNFSVKPKPFFPYRANHEGNYEPGDFPPASDFCPDSMTRAERGEFMPWYDKTRAEYKRTGRKYNMKQELYDYCVNDSEILLHALVEFRNLFNGLAGFDIFYQSCTFTGGCLRLFKQKFMKENSLAIFPPTGYGLAQRQSTKGMKYVKCLHRPTMFMCNIATMEARNDSECIS
ncbi:hypothetical protein AAVH_26108 [Aphelenchoides avenae]|nr:hypothetical protein AAVH_26108 [Aphelenchus avenae]